MDQDKFKSIINEILGSCVRAATQRTGVYAAGVGKDKKSTYRFREALKEHLYKIGKGYAIEVDDKTHLNNLKELIDEIEKHHTPILNQGKFRIGAAQKALNLYLKLLWCIGIHKVEPPHCPFDRNILTILFKKDTPAWTKLNSDEEYMEIVKKARRRAANDKLTLAQWELTTYNKR